MFINNDLRDVDCICENLGDITLHNLLICNLLDWAYERFSEAGNLVSVTEKP